MDRILSTYLKADLPNKILIISGPRQCGKTTLSKMLSKSFEYLNYDSSEHRKIILQKRWDRKKTVIILDEIHKMPKWKNWLKGIFDTEGNTPSIIVTGSSRLDTYKKMGDSLAGRYFQFRLHPFDIWELGKLSALKDPFETMTRILNQSGFPEPFLSDKPGFYMRWKQSHQEIILKQDLLEHETPQTIRQIEILIDLLKERVGSTLSYNSLCEDVGASDKTVKRWVQVLEDHFVVFPISPLHKNIAKATKKAQKFYFYDSAEIEGDDGAKLENLVACALFKQIHFRLDCLGEELEVSYFKTKDHKEIDFIISKKKKPFMAIEVKWSDREPSKNFREISKLFPSIQKIQLVGKLDREFTTPDGIEVRQAAAWLAKMPLG